MKKIFVLFRHGETDANLKQIIQGQSIDLSLNENGKIQAQQLSEMLLPLKMEVIFSSPLLRAMQTAQAISEKCKIQCKACDGLKEADYGEVEGMVWEDIRKQYPDICKNLFSSTRMSDRFPKGESKEEIQDRMYAVLISLSQLPYKTIGISSHGALISYFLMSLGRKADPIGNGDYFVVTYENGKFFYSK